MQLSESEPEVGIDLDGDGKTSAWESNLCRACIAMALFIAFGKEAMTLI